MMDRVLVAVTGGIGSGKSTVIDRIKKLNYKTFSCDEIYRELAKTKRYLKALSEVFPDSINESGELDRKKLSAVVFNNPNELKKLNDLAHPMIMEELKRKASLEKGVIFCEVPLLFEAKLEGEFDYVIIVSRSLRERIKAVRDRDGLSESEILRRIENQFDYEKIKTSSTNHFILKNDLDLQNLDNRINEFLSLIRQP